MQEAVPDGAGAMAAVLGLDDESVAAACAAAADGQVCSPANYNSPGQVVIAGAAEAVKRAGEEAKRRGARRIIPLEVSAPFHTALMQPATDRMRPLLEATEIRHPLVPVMTNATAHLVDTASEVRQALINQIASPVLWEQSIMSLAEFGVDRWIEMGPGKVLAGLVRKIVKGADCSSVERRDEIDVAFADAGAAATDF